MCVHCLQNFDISIPFLTTIICTQIYMSLTLCLQCLLSWWWRPFCSFLSVDPWRNTWCIAEPLTLWLLTVKHGNILKGDESLAVTWTYKWRNGTEYKKLLLPRSFFFFFFCSLNVFQEKHWRMLLQLHCSFWDESNLNCSEGNLSCTKNLKKKKKIHSTLLTGRTHNGTQKHND